MDIDPALIERAMALAKDRGVDNVRFEVGDAHKLPYPDASFDIVYERTVLMHLSDPLAALKEMRRVLRAGGICLLRGTDQGFSYQGPSPFADERKQVQLRSYELAGGSPFFCHRQKEFLFAAGFARAEQTAQAYSPSHAEILRNEKMYEEGFQRQARMLIEHGQLEQSRLDELMEDLKGWILRPDAVDLRLMFMAASYVD
jgi:SAM-dependent methyltransferase